LVRALPHARPRDRGRSRKREGKIQLGKIDVDAEQSRSPLSTARKRRYETQAATAEYPELPT
jgi:hypothetical protein